MEKQKKTLTQHTSQKTSICCREGGMEQEARITLVSLFIWMSWRYNSWNILMGNRASLKTRKDEKCNIHEKSYF